MDGLEGDIEAVEAAGLVQREGEQVVPTPLAAQVEEAVGWDPAVARGFAALDRMDATLQRLDRIINRTREGNE